MTEGSDDDVIAGEDDILNDYDQPDVGITAALQAARNDFLRVFPHESAIMFRRQLEMTICFSSLLVGHCTYLFINHAVSSQPNELEWPLFALCIVRFLFFLPRPMMWMKMHEDFVDASLQPTPQQVSEKLRLAMDSRPKKFWFSIFYYTWLVLVPMVIFSRSSSVYGARLWWHCQANYVWLFMSRLVNIIMFVCLRHSKLDRGITKRALEQSTKSMYFKSPWSGPGDSECAICFTDYVDGEQIRLLQCSHNFHTHCIDKWLRQYLNHCPICRHIVGPSEKKED